MANDIPGAAAPADSGSGVSDEVTFANAPETSDWGGLDTDFTTEVTADIEPVIEPAASPSPIQRPAPAAPSPAQPKTAVATPPVPPVVQPPVAPPVVAQPDPNASTKPSPQTDAPAASQPSSAGTELQAAIRGFQENEVSLVNRLAKEQFALSPQMVASLEAGNAAQEMPRLFAHVYLKAVKTALEMVTAHVPKLVDEGIGKFRTENGRDNEFFRRFPQLSREKHGSDIRALASSLKSAYPKASWEDLMSKIGPAVMAMHGVVAAQAPANTPVQSHRNGNAPFTPAAAARPAPLTTQPAPDSPWDGLWRED